MYCTKDKLKKIFQEWMIKSSLTGITDLDFELQKLNETKRVKGTITGSIQNEIGFLVYTILNEPINDKVLFSFYIEGISKDPEWHFISENLRIRFILKKS